MDKKPQAHQNELTEEMTDAHMELLHNQKQLAERLKPKQHPEDEIAVTIRDNTLQKLPFTLEELWAKIWV